MEQEVDERCEEKINIHVFYEIPKKNFEQFQKDLKKYSKWLSIDRTIGTQGQTRTSLGTINSCTKIKYQIITNRITEYLTVNEMATSKTLYNLIKKKSVIKYRNFTRLLEKLAVLNQITVKKQISKTGGYENIWRL